MSPTNAEIIKAISEAFEKAKMYDDLMRILKPNVKFTDAGMAVVREGKKQRFRQVDLAKLLAVAPASIAKYDPQP